MKIVNLGCGIHNFVSLAIVDNFEILPLKANNNTSIYTKTNHITLAALSMVGYFMYWVLYV